MPHGDWDSNSETQNKALAALCATATGGAYADNVRPKVRIATWRALHKLGNIRSDTSEVQHNSYVELTKSGREIGNDYRARHGLRKCVKFYLQPTKTFTDGAPQREEWDSDKAFDEACALYREEWLKEYECVGCTDAARYDCPQHSSAVRGR